MTFVHIVRYNKDKG